MRRIASLLAAVSCGFLMSCGDQASAPPDPWALSAARAPCPAGMVCLEAGNGSDMLSLDPHKVQGTWESRVMRDILVGLTDSDAEGNVIPGMAERWETSADGNTWTFYLRQANWSDGHPVTAEDFVFSLRRILDPNTAAEYASLLYFIKGAQPVNEGKAPLESLGVRAISPRILEIQLEHPAPYILELAKHQTMMPVPKHVVEKLGDAWSRPENHVSNGPYKIRSWTLGDRVIAERNPQFYAPDGICIDRVSYYTITDQGSMERLVASGELDMQSSPFPANRVPRLRERRGMADYVRTSTYLGVNYIPINTMAKDMTDPRVRLALSMAIDRDFITKGITMDVGYKSAYTFVPPGVANYTPLDPPEWASWTLERRQEEARRLLREAGYDPQTNPLRIEAKHRNVEANAMWPSMQNDWAKIGVKVTLVGAENQIAYQYYRLKDFQMGDAGWIADYNDAMSFLFLMHSSSGPMNYAGYNNPRFDALLDAADNEADMVKRAGYLREAEQIMLDDVTLIPTYFIANIALVNPRVTGYIDNITDEHPTRFLCFADRPGR